MKKLLCVGGTGFVGKHLVEIADYEVFVTGRTTDIRNLGSLRELVERVRPDAVINLASLTTVKETFDDPQQTYETGLIGSLNLLESLAGVEFRGCYLNVSSSEVYGHPQASELPLLETSPLRPMSPYSVSKLAVEALCYQWSQSALFRIVTARPFTHVGPAQSERFALSAFSRQIAGIVLGQRSPAIQVGNLNTMRDITDVRDVVAAYLMLLDRGENGEVYNVCSGREYMMRDLLDQLLELAGITSDVVVNPEAARDKEQTRIRGDYSKLRQLTGWEPQFLLEQTLEEMFENWKVQLAR
jgi:GDP-4-dehydro-6-deoxy-D-mannose reductase